MVSYKALNTSNKNNPINKKTTETKERKDDLKKKENPLKNSIFSFFSLVLFKTH